MSCLIYIYIYYIYIYIYIYTYIYILHDIQSLYIERDIDR